MAAPGPLRLEHTQSLVGRECLDGPGDVEVTRAYGGGQLALPLRLEVAGDGILQSWRRRPVLGRHRVVGMPLEHEQMVGRVGQDRYGLDSRRSGADDPDPPSVQGDWPLRPPIGLQPLALVTIQARKADRLRFGKVTCAHDQEAARYFVALIGFQMPPVVVA